MIMTSTRQPFHDVRGRNKVACVNCHTRKVRCDLHNLAGKPCSNCWKYGMLCKRRPSPRATIRQRYAAKQTTRSPSSVESSQRESQVLGLASEGEYGDHASQQTHSTVSGPLHRQYLGEMCSVLGDTPSLPPNHSQMTAFSKRVNQEILRISEATAQVPEIVLRAYAEAYFQYAFHRFPVLDYADIFREQPPIVLCQAVCMVGSKLRRSRQSASMAESEKYYFKAKTLVQMDFEQDPITTLQALCLLSTWSGMGPVVLTSDCAWHWLGTATRRLQQIGLNREAACACQPRPGISRRLAWYLYTQDKFVSAALGRPTTIKPNEFDVNSLTKGDFELPNTAAMVFMEAAKLACILGRILDLRFRWPENWELEHRAILALLKNWIEGLPEGLRIYDSLGRRIYRRDVYEIHILYFATIITYLHLFGDQTIYSAPSLACLVASSCLTRLYQEMDLRDDICYLFGIHTWCLVVTAVPQLIWLSAEAFDGHNNLCAEELDILTTVLKQYQTQAYGGTLVLNAINRLREQQTQGCRGTIVPRETLPSTFADGAHDMTVLRGLFPLPHSISPRLTLLESTTEEIFSDMGNSAVVSEDISWILEEFSDLSNSLAFPDGSNLVARGFSNTGLG